MKALLFNILNMLGLNALFRWLHRGQIKVLLYHNVTPGAAHFANALAPEEFDAQIAELKRTCNVIRIDQHGQWVGLSNTRVNVLISFDDGFINNLTHALPVLQKHGVSGIFFLIADCLAEGAPPHFVKEEGEPFRTLTAAQAKQMAGAGMTIGSHSMAHRDHRALSEEEMLSDSRQARDIVSAAINRPVNLFAFPWGYYTSGQERKLASEFARIFLTRHGFAKADDNIIPRNEVTDLAHLRVATSGLLDWLRSLAGKETPY